jgi:aryl-alcohol dehydrogenase-like predicted oxidoreductase
MNSFRPLGSTGLDCHWLGFGCYRIAKGNAGHEAALRGYLERGGNLIDTSANYGDGASEELVGEVLRDEPREKVILVTKGGYIQGQNMALAQQRGFPEVVEYGPGIWHSIHPEFLATQIELSCARLRQDHVDVYLLHNPEYFLEDISHRREVTAADHDEFYRRIREAFRFLEEKAAEGKIRWYGVSSNNFGQPAGQATATSIARCWEQAASLSENHRFRVVQLPLNLYEAGGALASNNEGASPLEYCRQKGLAVLANRPLNAFQQNELIRLADWAEAGKRPPDGEDLRRRLAPLTAQESAFEQWAGEPIQLAGGGAVTQLLLELAPRLWSVAHWEQVAGRHVVEPIQAWLIQTQQRYQQDAQWLSWRDRFLDSINPALREVREHLGAQQQRVSDQVRERLLRAGYPAAEHGRSLSRMALDVLAGLAGLSCALVGMRRLEYVDDAMGAQAVEGIDSAALLERFNSPST